MPEQETFTKEQFWKELDELGEDAVRERIATRRYGRGNHKLDLAEEWLRKREESRSETVRHEQIGIDRSAKNAAWVAAIAATIAAIIGFATLYLMLKE